MTSKKSNTENSLICRCTLSQISAVMVKNVVLMGYGMSIGFPTLLIPDLSGRKLDDPLYLGEEGISWIGSINLITIPLGCLMSGVVTQPLGRRRSMQLINIPFCISWTIYYFSYEAWHILITLAITGIAGGLMEAPVLTYVAEICQPHLRGTLSSSASVSVAAGIMTEFILGKFLHWKSAALCSLVVPILSFSLLFLIPETPPWLLSKKRYEEAKHSLTWLRGWVSEEEVDKEYEELLFNLRINKQSKDYHIIAGVDGSATFVKKLSVIKMLSKRNFIRPFILLSFVCFLVHFCGLSPIQVYAVKMFDSLHSPIDGRSATAILGVVGLIGSLVCVSIVHKCGRRITSFISLTGTAIAFFVLGTYTYWYQINNLSPTNNLTNSTEHAEVELGGSTSWYPFAALIFGAFSAQMGIRILPWTMVGEVFPHEIRALAAGLMGMNFYFFGFFCNKTFLTYVSFVTLPGTFWTFSAISTIGVIVLYLVLPETEGKTLHEITEHFSGRSKLGKKVQRINKNVEEENEQSEKLYRDHFDTEKR